MNKDEELRLARSAAAGDEAAFEQLVMAHQKFVYNLALKITGSPEDALDISQDVFIKVYTGLGAFRGDSRLSVWLYRLTYNASMDHIKKNRPAGTYSLSGDEENEAHDVPDPHPQPEEETERRELQREVWSAMDELSQEKREILVMRELRGMSYAKIGEELGLEEGTVKSRISRSRLALADILKKRGTFSGRFSSNGKKGGHENG